MGQRPPRSLSSKALREPSSTVARPCPHHSSGNHVSRHPRFVCSLMWVPDQLPLFLKKENYIVLISILIKAFAFTYQVQQQKHVLRGNQIQQACLPMQMSISMPLYNNPMVFSQTHPITVSTPMPAEMTERQQQPDYSQDRSLRYRQLVSELKYLYTTFPSLLKAVCKSKFKTQNVE